MHFNQLIVLALSTVVVAQVRNEVEFREESSEPTLESSAVNDSGSSAGDAATSVKESTSAIPTPSFLLSSAASILSTSSPLSSGSSFPVPTGFSTTSKPGSLLPSATGSPAVSGRSSMGSIRPSSATSSMRPVSTTKINSASVGKPCLAVGIMAIGVMLMYL